MLPDRIEHARRGMRSAVVQAAGDAASARRGGGGRQAPGTAPAELPIRDEHAREELSQVYHRVEQRATTTGEIKRHKAFESSLGGIDRVRGITIEFLGKRQRVSNAIDQTQLPSHRAPTTAGRCPVN